MSRTIGLFLAAATTGCCGFEPLTDEVSPLLVHFPKPRGPYVRLRVRLEIDSPSLSGRFEGVILGKTGAQPVVRAQFFPDVGGKVIDLVARPDRMTGYFPALHEGIDMALPQEAKPHPLALMGVTLLEHFAPVTEDRVLGARRRSEGDVQFRMAGVAAGVTVDASGARAGARVPVIVREFRWIFGIRWTEWSLMAQSSQIESPKMRAHVEIIEMERPDSVPVAALELKLPSDVRRADR